MNIDMIINQDDEQSFTVALTKKYNYVKWDTVRQYLLGKDPACLFPFSDMGLCNIPTGSALDSFSNPEGPTFLLRVPLEAP